MIFHVLFIDCADTISVFCTALGVTNVKFPELMQNEVFESVIATKTRMFCLNNQMEIWFLATFVEFSSSTYEISGF